MKKIIIIVMSAFIAFSPLMSISNFSYADTLTDQWLSITTNQQYVAALKAYADSRGNRSILASSLTGNGLIGNIVKFKYMMWKSHAAVLGIDMDELQTQIRYRVDSNGSLQFLYEHSAINSLNQIFSEILQEYGVTENSNTRIYSGEIFTDADGHSCFVYHLSNSYSQGQFVSQSSYENSIEETGTNFLENGDYYFNNSMNSITINFNSNLSKTYTFVRDNNNSFQSCKLQNINQYLYLKGTYFSNKYIPGLDSCFAIFKFKNGNYSFGILTQLYNQTTDKYEYSMNTEIQPISNSDITNVLVDMAQQGLKALSTEMGKSAAIDVGKYGADAINNYLEDQEPENEPSVDDDVDDGDEPIFPTPTPPNNSLPTGGILSPDGDGGFNFNFQMPDFSNFNWNLGFDVNNMPFPFSIPFDIINFLNVLDSTPQAPRYEIHTTIYNTPVNLDIDLSVFNDGMVIIRNIILAGYCIFLIIATRALFHIY